MKEKSSYENTVKKYTFWEHEFIMNFSFQNVCFFIYGSCQKFSIDFGSVFMKIIGYNRVSTKNQKLDRGEKDIIDFCESRNLPLKRIYTDKATGRNFLRPRYTVMKEDVLERGDILILPEVDRLGRNKKEIVKELEYFKENGIRVMILEIPTTLMDISTMETGLSNLIMDAINNMMIEMYALFAQAEVDKKAERQEKGIAAMKARGDWHRYGRPKVMQLDEFKVHFDKVLTGKKKPFEVMRELRLTESTYYRYRKYCLEENR